MLTYTRFPAPPQQLRSGRDRFWRECMQELEDQALREWQPLNGEVPRAVKDFDSIEIPPSRRRYAQQAVDVLSVAENTIAYSSGTNAVTFSSVTGVASQAQTQRYPNEGFPNGSSSQQRHRGHGHYRGRGGPSRKRDHSGQSDRNVGQGHWHQQGDGTRREDKRSRK